jgi:hypothetical protein
MRIGELKQLLRLLAISLMRVRRANRGEGKKAP